MPKAASFATDDDKLLQIQRRYWEAQAELFRRLSAGGKQEPVITPEVTPEPALPEASGKETPEPTTQTPSGDTSADAEWPEGETGWTVVLASDSSESDAREKADDFAQDGIGGVGVLDSDDFRSLKGDLWVVFAGHYETQAAASDALDGDLTNFHGT